ncbi:MAG: PDZ domain-containing protein, partial [Planctomycetaceae bacterium]
MGGEFGNRSLPWEATCAIINRPRGADVMGSRRSEFVPVSLLEGEVMGCQFRLLALLLLICLTSVSSGEDRVVGHEGEELRRMVRQLAAEEFAIREQAEVDLICHGVASAPYLWESAQSTDPELAVRSVEVLVKLYLKLQGTKTDEMDQVAMQLEALAGVEDVGASVRAQSALSRLQNVRHERAIADLKRLGAKVDMAPDRDRLLRNLMQRYGDSQPEMIQRKFDETLSQAEIIRETRKEIPLTVGNVFFTDRWQGGEEGLRHLKRLRRNEETFQNLAPVQVYITTDSTVSREAVQLAASALGHVEVQVRGPSLGVQGSSLGGEGCYISSLIPGGAADQAGFIQGDRILRAIAIEN